MDYVVLVAVVDARQNLLHEDCSVLLCELASSDDLVEEFSTLADPIGYERNGLAYSVTM